MSTSDPSKRRGSDHPGPESLTRWRCSSTCSGSARCGSPLTAPRSRPGPGWTGISGVTSTDSARAAAYSQPDHTTAVLGPLPGRITGAEQWQSAAGAIEAYRGRWSLETSDALGPEPRDPEQRAHWQRAVGAVESAGFAAPGGSGGELDQPWLSSLWDRLHALDTARSDAARDVTPLPEPSAFSWSRDSGSGRDLGDGLGL